MKSYRPSNGTEGIDFYQEWCFHCARDEKYREDVRNSGCPIIAASLAYVISDPNYPKEWVYDSQGRPCCLAYTKDASQPLRCMQTLDLFSGE